jgi:hypothetical protein
MKRRKDRKEYSNSSLINRISFHPLFIVIYCSPELLTALDGHTEARKFMNIEWLAAINVVNIVIAINHVWNDCIQWVDNMVECIRYALINPCIITQVILCWWQNQAINQNKIWIDIHVLVDVVELLHVIIHI